MKVRKPKFYVIYARFSPRPDANNCESLQIQEEVCRAYAAKHGGTVVAVYGDPDLSGADEDRPGLWQAIDALKPGYTLLVWKLDRLYRSVYLSEYLMREFKKKRAGLETVENGELSDRPDDMLVRKILAAVDDHFRVIGNARTKVSMLRHQKERRAMSADPPYGMRRAPDRLVVEEGVEKLQRRWEDDPDELRVVERILSLHASGESFYGIAKTLNEEGVPSRGQEWDRTTIGRICKRAVVESLYARA